MEHCTLLGVLLRIGVSCLPTIPNELFSPIEPPQANNMASQQLQRAQHQWAMQVSGTTPTPQLATDSDPPITRFQIRRDILHHFAGMLQISPTDVIMASSCFPWPKRVTNDSYSSSKRRIHGALTPVWDNMHRVVHAALKNKTQRYVIVYILFETPTTTVVALVFFFFVVFFINVLNVLYIDLNPLISF